MIILVAGQKGGVGKTTIAVNLVTMRILAGIDTHLLDIDPQLTSTLWASRRDENQILPRVSSTQKYLDPLKVLSPGIVIRNEVKALTSKYEDIIIDAGGANNEVLRAAMLLADKIIFPTKPGEFDMWTFSTLDRLTAEAQSGDKQLISYIALNMLDATPAVAKEDIEKCDEYLENYQYLKRLDTILYNRRAISKANDNGMTVIEFKPKDKKAIAELEELYKEIFNGN